MLSRRGTWLVAFAVALTGTLVVVPAPPPVEAAPTPVPTPVPTLRVLPADPMAGERVGLRVRVPSAGIRPVHLQRRQARGWVTIKRARTNRRGVAVLAFRVPRGPVRLRAVAPRHRIGARVFHRQVTQPVRLRPSAQSAMVAVSRDSAGRVRVRAMVSHPRAGRTVRLELRPTGGRWRPVAATRAGRSRAVALPVVMAEALDGGRLRVVLAPHRGAPATRTAPIVPPTVSLTPPVVDGDVVRATVTTTGTVERVRFFVDGVLVAEDTAAPWEASWPARVGRHDVVARAVGPVAGAPSHVAEYVVDGTPVGADDGVAEGFAWETVQSGLTLPTSAAALPSGALLVTEKSGRVQVVEPLADGGHAPPRTVLDLSDEVEDGGDTGLIGIAVAPDVARTGHVYLSYVLRADGGGLDRTQQVARFTWDGRRIDPATRHVVLGSVTGPECSTDGDVRTPDCLPLHGLAHTVGDLAFDDRGRLLVGVGDGALYAAPGGLAGRHHMLRAQDPEVLAGKVLRVDPLTGRGVPDNPLFTADGSSNASRVLALGLRNPFRFTLDAGRLVIGDVGETSTEEINVVRLGELGTEPPNFGWPCLEGETETALGDITGADHAWHGCLAVRRPGGAVPPVHSYAHDQRGGSVSGGIVLSSPAYPDRWRGRYVFGDYAQNFMRTAALSPTGEVSGVEPLADSSAAGGPVKFLTGPDGLLWSVGILTGALHRLRWTGADLADRCAIGSFRRTFHDLDGADSVFDRDFPDDAWSWLFPYAAARLPAAVLAPPTCEPGITLDSTGSPWLPAGEPDRRAHPGDRFGAAWTGRVELEEGTYRFQVDGDEWVRLWVDDRPVHDFYAHPFWGEESRRHDIALGRGQHVIRAETVHGDRERARATVTWERVGGPPSIRLVVPDNAGIPRDGRVTWAVEVSDPDGDTVEQLTEEVELAVDFLHYTGAHFHAHPSSRVRGRLTGTLQVDDAHSPGLGVVRLRASVTDTSGARATSAPVYVCFPGGDVGPCSDGWG